MHRQEAFAYYPMQKFKMNIDYYTECSCSTVLIHNCIRRNSIWMHANNTEARNHLDSFILNCEKTSLSLTLTQLVFKSIEGKRLIPGNANCHETSVVLSS